MLAQELIDNAIDAVKPGSDGYDATWFLAKLNEFARRISSHRNILLPALDTEATVTAVASASSVNLPANYQRNLYSCQRVSDGQFVHVANSRKSIIDGFGGVYPTYTGSVDVVTAVRPTLIYAPKPVADEALTIRYYRIPSAITLSTDLLSLIPDGFDDLPFHFLCWKAFERIEQGLEGAKVDTNHHMSIYLGMQDQLELHLREGVSLPDPPIVRMQW